jgi:hypothetical protein
MTPPVVAAVLAALTLIAIGGVALAGALNEKPPYSAFRDKHSRVFYVGPWP